MLLTEEEARTKWCPHAVASHTDPRAGFRGDGQEPCHATHPCIASVCMSWRWAPAYDYSQINGLTYRTGVAKPTRGWCGLAGSPE